MICWKTLITDEGESMCVGCFVLLQPKALGSFNQYHNAARGPKGLALLLNQRRIDHPHTKITSSEMTQKHAEF